MENLDKWIQSQLDSGYSQDKIFQSLLKAGYSEQEARSSIQRVLSQKKSQFQSKPQSESKPIFTQYKSLISIVIIILIVSLVGVHYFVPQNNPEKFMKSNIQYKPIDNLTSDVHAKEFIEYMLYYVQCYPDKYYERDESACFTCYKEICFPRIGENFRFPYILSNTIDVKMVNMFYWNLASALECEELNSKELNCRNSIKFILNQSLPDKIKKEDIYIEVNGDSWMGSIEEICNSLTKSKCSFSENTCTCSRYDIQFLDGKIIIKENK